MTIRKLEVFVTVCKYMNMAAASRELYISPPAISKIISEIEDFYNITLFVRVGRNIYLTDAGNELYSNAISVLENLKKLNSAMKYYSNVPVIRLGSTPTASATFLPKTIKDYNDQIGDCRIIYSVFRAPEIEQKIFSGQLDFGVYAGRSQLNGIATNELFEDELIFICSKDNPIYNKLSLDEKNNHILEYGEDTHLELFVREKSSTSFALIDSKLSNSNIEYSICGTINNIDGIILCAQMGLGIGVVSKFSHLPENVCPFRIQNIHMKRKFSLFYSQQRTFPPSFMEFKDFICGYRFK